MPEWYKKRILQRPGQEAQLITERPSEFYQLESPDFKIPTVTNSEDSIMTGLENRKWRDIWEHKGRASGINNTDEFLQQKHPSLFLLPFAPEVMRSGLGLGVLKTLGGYAGSYVGSKIGNEVGYALDNTFNKQLFEPLGEVVGGFAGFGKGYNLFEKAGMQGALKYLSNTGKEIPRWFMRPELRANVGRVNRRTFFAEDQTPKYNPNQLQGLNKQPYQSPSASQWEMIPQAGFMSNIRYGYSLPNATRGNLKQIDNFIENDIFPRMRAAGHNIEYGKITMPSLRQFDPKNDLVDRYISINGNKNASAWFSPTDNTVTFRGTSPEEADYSKAIHEIGGHGVRRNINPDYKPTTREKLNELLRLNESALYSKNVELPDINIADEVYLPQEEILLNTSYEPFFKGGDGEGNIKEYDAVNKQLRARISQMNGHKVGNDLNPIIDKFSDARLLSLLRDLPYTQNGTLKQLSDITGIDEDTLMFASDLELNRLTNKYPDISRLLKRIKDTMKYVGGISAVGIGMNSIPQKQ